MHICSILGEKIKNFAFAIKTLGVTENVRYEFPNIDHINGEVKKVFIKAHCPKKALTGAGQTSVSEPCLTRWNKALVE